jgi:hypothetical protein
MNNIGGDQYSTVIERKSERSKSREKPGPNALSMKENTEPVQERLLKKGMEYKNNLNHKRHEVIKDMIKNGPSFQPKLISKNDQYLKNRRTEEENMVRNEVGIGNHFYYEAMVYLMNKQTKIIDYQKLQMTPRIPEMNSKSKEMVQ